MNAKNWLAVGIIPAIIFCIGSRVYGNADRGIFVDVYGGPQITNNSDFTLEAPIQGNTVKLTYPDLQWKSGMTIGGRAGYWFNSFLGAGLDFFGYSVATKEQDITVAYEYAGTSGNVKGKISEDADKISVKALGFNLMARYPGKIFQPYLGIAPVIFFNEFSEPSTAFTANSTNVGFAVPVGLKAIVFREERISIGLFAEAKMTYNPLKGSGTYSGVESTGKTNLFSTHFLFGLSLDFSTGNR